MTSSTIQHWKYSTSLENLPIEEPVLRIQLLGKQKQSVEDRRKCGQVWLDCTKNPLHGRPPVCRDRLTRCSLVDIDHFCFTWTICYHTCNAGCTSDTPRNWLGIALCTPVLYWFIVNCTIAAVWDAHGMDIGLATPDNPSSSYSPRGERRTWGIVGALLQAQYVGYMRHPCNGHVINS